MMRQYITMTLGGVVDDHDNQGNVPATFGVFLGDVTANGVVNGNDLSVVQSDTDSP